VPKFDYTAAKAAGHTDQEIAAYLSKQKAAGVDVYLSKSEVAAARSPLPDGLKAAAPVAQAGMGVPSWAREALPSVGGFVGGAAGTVLGIPGGPPGMFAGGVGGAALGGSAGEIIRRGIENRPMDPMAIGLTGAGEGAWQVLGGGLAKGAAKVSPFLARRAAALAAAPKGGFLSGGILGGLLGQATGHGVAPAAIGGAVLKGASDSPMVNAALAKLLASMAFQRAARQSPRVAAAMVQQVLSAEPDQTYVNR